MKVEWNHEKADSRFILLTSQETNDVVIVAKDTDVLVSLVRKDICLYSIKRNLFFKYDAEKYANIRKFCDYLGKVGYHRFIKNLLSEKRIENM